MKKVFKILIAVGLLFFIACKPEVIKPDATFNIEVPSRPNDNIFETGVYAGESVLFYTDKSDADSYVLYTGGLRSNYNEIESNILSDTIKENFQTAFTLSYDNQKKRYATTITYQYPGKIEPTLISTVVDNGEVKTDKKSMEIEVKDFRTLIEKATIVYRFKDDLFPQTNRDREGRKSISWAGDNIGSFSLSTFIDLTTIKMTFDSRNAVVFYEGQELISNETILDFSSGSIKLNVKPHDGNEEVIYTIALTIGGSNLNQLSEIFLTPRNSFDNIEINQEEKIINFEYINNFDFSRLRATISVPNYSRAINNDNILRDYYEIERYKEGIRLDITKPLRVISEDGSSSEYTFIGTPQATHFELQGLSEVTNDRKVFTVDNTTTPVTYSMQLDPVYEIDGELLLTPIFEKNSLSKVYYMNGSDKVNIDSEEDQIDFNLVNKLYIENGSELDSVNVNITLY